MLTNPGLRKIDPESPVGQIRLNVGDTSFTELEPRSADLVNYTYFSDPELAAFQTQGSGSVLRATSLAFSRLALHQAMTGATIRTNDLGYSDEKRGSTLQQIAEWWAEQADRADEAALDESLEIVGFPGNAATPATPRVF